MDTLSLIKYFTDCYRADNREFSIENFFSSKFENQILQNLEEELINGKYKHQYLPSKEGEVLLKNLQLYKRDKQLYYCSLFLVGKRKLFNKKTLKTCAPIFFYPSEIEQQTDGEHFIKLHIEDRQVNYGFLRTLDFNFSFEKFQKEFTVLLDQEVIDYPFIAQMQRLFEKHIANISFSEEIPLFPKLLKSSVVRKHFLS